jgi:hypothetical protein
MGGQLPRSVINATRAQWALVAVSGLLAVLTAVRRDRLVADWVARNPTLLPSSAPSFVPVAIVCFITFALLAAVLLAFFRAGHPSARLSLTGLAVFFLFAMVVLVRQDPPGLFALVAVVAALVDLVVGYFLWHPDTSEFLRGAELADELDG